MHSSLRFFRYFVFGLFLACNAIIITAAVWNLNLVQDALFPSSSLPLQTDAYLVFVGCAGLALIIPVLFCELASKNIFLVSVWFECIWVALFCIMELAGAASASAAGTDELCPPVYWIAIAVDRGSICTSSRLLQAFSWICGLLLLAYFVLFFVTTLLVRREDNTVWRCNASRFPWEGARHKLDNPTSPTEKPEDKRRSFIASVSRKLSGKSGKVPTIACPRPRNAATEAVRRAILSYRSGLSVDYTIEHFRPEDPVVESPGERPLPPAPLIIAPEPPTMVTREATTVTFGQSLYPQHMHSVLPPERQAQAPPPERRAQSEDAPRSPPTPSPVGDWPRMNPSTPLPKRKSRRIPPVVTESRQRQQSYPPLGPVSRQRQSSFPPASSVPAPTSPVASPVHPLPTFDFESSRFSVSQVVPPSSLRSPPPAALLPSSAHPPPPSFPSTRSRPSGPRRPSLEENRNPTHAGSYTNPRSHIPITRS